MRDQLVAGVAAIAHRRVKIILAECGGTPEEWRVWLGGDGRLERSDDLACRIGARVRVAPLRELVTEYHDAGRTGDTRDGGREGLESHVSAVQLDGVVGTAVVHLQRLQDGFDGAQALG